MSICIALGLALGLGLGLNRKVSAIAAAAAYAGPGNVLGAASAFWGLRAYSLATIGNNCVRLIRASDSAQQDFVTTASGLVDIAAINTFLNATTGKVVTFYELTGRGSTFDLTQATDANRAAWVANSGNPYVQFSSAGSNGYATSGSESLAQPFTFATTLQNTSGETFVLTQGFNAALAVEISAHDGWWAAFAANDAIGTGFMDGSWWAANVIFNGASAALYRNGSNVGTGDCGAHSLSGPYEISSTSFASYFNGLFREWGVWPTAQIEIDATNYSVNSRAFWNY